MSTAFPHMPPGPFPVGDAAIARSGFGDSIPADMEQLWERLGGIPLNRIRLVPQPGTATADDAADSRDLWGINCELVDGVLVSKPMGWYESRIAAALIHFIETYLESDPRGLVVGEDGPIRLASNVRKPDVAFTSFERLPSDETPEPKVMSVAPDLAVEVLSESNTKAEMERKLNEYFSAGVKVVWFIQPKSQTARIFTALDRVEEIPADGRLHSGMVLPGFDLPLRTLFERARRGAPNPPALQ